MILEKVMTSEKFKQDVISYLDKTLVGEQTDEITRKLLGLVKKWKSTLQVHNIDVFKGLCKSIETDAKFKLPWTTHELHDAIQTFVRLSNKGALDGK